MGAFGDRNFSSSIAALTSLLSEFVESQVKSSQVPPKDLLMEVGWGTRTLSR